MIHFLLAAVLVGVFPTACTSVPVVTGASVGRESTTSEREARPAWLGVSIQDLTSKLARSMNLTVEEGALVNRVEKESPAEAAGIAEGDVIVEFDGRKIYDADDLVKAVRRAKAGVSVSVVVVRKNETKKIDVTLERRPRSLSRAFSLAVPSPPLFWHGAVRSQGMTVRTLNEQLAEYFQVPGKKGVLVEEVEKKSAAEEAGLKAGDVILKVGTRTVETVRDLWRALDRYDEGEKVNLEVVRKGSKRTIELTIEDPGEMQWFEYRTRPRGRLDVPESDSFRGFLREFEFEHLRPELDRLRIELERLGDELRIRKFEFDDTIREHIVRPRVIIRHINDA